MKRAIIGALVGAILVFGWQAVAHMFLHHHDAAFKKVPNQEAVISNLSSTLKEEGQYLIPRSDLQSTQEEMVRFNEGMKGKPWAVVTYHTSYKNDMGIAITRSFVTAFLCVLILIGILGKNPGNLGSIFAKCLGVAVFMFLFVYYNSNIWMQTPWEVIQGELVDLLVAWSLCGIWLGYWFNRKKKVKRYSSVKNA
jgi:hypothetical protein